MFIHTCQEGGTWAPKPNTGNILSLHRNKEIMNTYMKLQTVWSCDHSHAVNKRFTCHSLGWHCPPSKWLWGSHYSLQGWWNGGSQEPWGPHSSLWNQWQSEAEQRRDRRDILRVTTAVIHVILHKHAHMYFYFCLCEVFYPPPWPKSQVSRSLNSDLWLWG